MQRRIIGYARVNHGGESSLNRQIAQLKAAGAMEVLVDMQSGQSTERTGLKRLMTMIESNQVETVMVTRVDRLSRSSIQLRQLLDVCRDKDALVQVLSQNLLLP